MQYDVNIFIYYQTLVVNRNSASIFLGFIRSYLADVINVNDRMEFL